MLPAPAQPNAASKPHLQHLQHSAVRKRATPAHRYVLTHACREQQATRLQLMLWPAPTALLRQPLQHCVTSAAGAAGGALGTSACSNALHVLNSHSHTFQCVTCCYRPGHSGHPGCCHGGSIPACRRTAVKGCQRFVGSALCAVQWHGAVTPTSLADSIGRPDNPKDGHVANTSRLSVVIKRTVNKTKFARNHL